MESKLRSYFFTFIFLAALASPAHVSAALIAAIVFTSSPQTIPLSTPSGIITVEAQDSGGSPVNGNTVCLQITSSSATGEFSTNANTWSGQPGPLTLTLSTSEYRRNFYYRDSANGADTLTLQAALRTGSSCTSWSPAQGVSWSATQLITAGDVVDESNSPNDISDTANNVTPDQTMPQSSGGPSAPAMTVDAGGDRTVEAGAGAFFTGHLYNADGIPIQNARYIWNFGDGEVREGQTVFYAYPYAGIYVVTLAVDAGNNYSAEGRALVEAVPPEVSLAAASDGSLTVTNTTHSKNELDLSIWMLARGGNTFTIPKGTIILPGKSVRFSPGILNIGTSSTAELLYPNGYVAASTDPLAGDAHAPGIEYLDAEDLAPSPASSPSRVPKAAAAPPPAAASPGETAASAMTAALPAAVAAAHADLSPLFMSAAGLAALLIFAVAGVSYARLKPADGNEDSSPADSEEPTADADELAEEFFIEDITPREK